MWRGWGWVGRQSTADRAPLIEAKDGKEARWGTGGEGGGCCLGLQRGGGVVEKKPTVTDGSLPVQELEAEGNLRQAEHHFTEAGDWKAAVNMYRGQDLWDEAYRVSHQLIRSAGSQGWCCALSHRCSLLHWWYGGRRCGLTHTQFRFRFRFFIYQVLQQESVSWNAKHINISKWQHWHTSASSILGCILVHWCYNGKVTKPSVRGIILQIQLQSQIFCTWCQIKFSNFLQSKIQCFDVSFFWSSTFRVCVCVSLWQVAKAHGGPTAAKQVAYLWAKSLGGDSAVKLLNKFGLLDAAIDYAAENWSVLTTAVCMCVLLCVCVCVCACVWISQSMFYFMSVHNNAILDQCVVVDEYVCVHACVCVCRGCVGRAGGEVCVVCDFSCF